MAKKVPEPQPLPEPSLAQPRHPQTEEVAGQVEDDPFTPVLDVPPTRRTAVNMQRDRRVIE